MRLAFISTMKGSPWGGSEELWAAAASRALDAGHRVAICTFDWPEPAPRVSSLIARGALPILRPLRPNKLTRLVHGQRPPWLHQLEAFAPDSICLSQGGAYECAGRRSTRPLIPWLARTRTPVVSVVQFNSETADAGPDARPLARELYSLARVNAFVAARNITQAEAKLGITIERTRVLINPVNLTDTSPVPWPESTTTRLACVARLDAATKGQDLLLSALSTPEWSARDWTLNLYGTGPDLGRFQQIAPPPPRTHFPGHTADIRALWAAHHALILPSRAEGTPLAMVEAMLLGRPVVVTDVGGCADWVRDGVEGFLAPEATVAALAAALERAWTERARWPAIGAAARARALTLHDPDAGATLLALL